MHISLSELEATVCKAASGVGLPLGLGEDAGRIARRISIFGPDAAKVLTNCFEGLDSGRAHKFDIGKALGGSFVSAKRDGALSALWVAPVLCDRLLAQALLGCRPSRVLLSNLDGPAVVLFACLEISARLETCIHVSWAGSDGEAIEALCHRGSLHCDRGGLTQLVNTTPQDLQVSFSDRVEVGRFEAIHFDPTVLRNGIEVNTSTWRRLTRFAERCLVEGSESSRMTGAGAGLVDTD